jgi:hypothetical protein
MFRTSPIKKVLKKQAFGVQRLESGMILELLIYYSNIYIQQDANITEFILSDNCIYSIW